MQAQLGHMHQVQHLLLWVEKLVRQRSKWPNQPLKVSTATTTESAMSRLTMRNPVKAVEIGHVLLKYLHGNPGGADSSWRRLGSPRSTEGAKTPEDVGSILRHNPTAPMPAIGVSKDSWCVTLGCLSLGNVGPSHL